MKREDFLPHPAPRIPFHVSRIIAYNPTMVEGHTARRAGGRSYLRGDPIPWLLEPANPSARYLTLRQVLCRPEDAPDVVEAQAGILHAEPAASILAAQWPAGHWVAPDRGYTPRYRATVWQIMFLAQLGAPRDPHIELACEFVWQHSRRADGLFTPHKRPRLEDLANLNGSLLWALVQFGYAGDPRMEQVLEVLAGLNLAQLLRANHVSAVVKLSKGLQALSIDCPAPLRSFLDDATGLIARDFPQRVDDRYLDLWFPVAEKTDLLEMLAVLQETNAVSSPQVRTAIDSVVRKQDGGGSWPLAPLPGKMWASVGEPGRANKWVTIRALRVLRALDEVA